MKDCFLGYKVIAVLVFTFGLLLRFLLLPYGNHHDLLVNAEWGKELYSGGYAGFYNTRSWVYGSPTQLPLVNIIYAGSYSLFGKEVLVFSKLTQFLSDNNFAPKLFEKWFTFFDWFAWKYYNESPFPNGYLLNIKLWPVLADVGIAGIIFFVAKKVASIKKATFLASIYLFMPFSWYESALWGQYDQIAVFFLITSFFVLELLNRRSRIINLFVFILSLLFFVASFQIKPTNVFIAPLYVYYFFSKKPRFIDLAFSFGIVFAITLALFVPFLDPPNLSELNQIVFGNVFNRDRNALATHSFNLWQGLYPVGRYSVDTKFLGVKSIFWALFFYVVLNVLAFLNFSRNKSLKNLLVSVFIVGGGFYIFLTGMLDRYYFLGAVSLLFLLTFYSRLVLLVILSEFLFSLNLFLSWGYPFDIYLFYKFWDNSGLVIRLLSLMHVVLFLLITCSVVSFNVTLVKNFKESKLRFFRK